KQDLRDSIHCSLRESTPAFGLVQRDGRAKQCLQSRLVDLLALAEVDRAPGVAFETGIEEARRVLQRRASGERQLDGALVGLAGADDSVMRPHRDAPLPRFD